MKLEMRTSSQRAPVVGRVQTECARMYAAAHKVKPEVSTSRPRGRSPDPGRGNTPPGRTRLFPLDGAAVVLVAPPVSFVGDMRGAVPSRDGRPRIPSGAAGRKASSYLDLRIGLSGRLPSFPADPGRGPGLRISWPWGTTWICTLLVQESGPQDGDGQKHEDGDAFPSLDGNTR